MKMPGFTISIVVMLSCSKTIAFGGWSRERKVQVSINSKTIRGERLTVATGNMNANEIQMVTGIM